MNKIQELIRLRDRWLDSHKEFLKAQGTIFGHLGISDNPKVKRKKFHQIEQKKFDKLDDKREEYELTKSLYFAALYRERSYWTNGYWFKFHLHGNSFSHKKVVSDTKSMIKNWDDHTNIVSQIESPNLRLAAVRHLRAKGLGCDCVFCEFMKKHNSSVYKKLNLI